MYLNPINPMQLGGVLYVYKGEWDLPSIDFECLRALCLVKFARCPVKIECTNANPLKSGAGKLPYLQIGNQKFVGYGNIKKVLDKEGFRIDAFLSGKEKQLSQAYANWVFSNLHAFYHYFMFGEPNNFDVVRSLYAKRTPFPFNFYYPSTYQKEANDIINVLANFDIYDKIEKHGNESLETTAKKCVNVLSKKLGQKIWFFGDNYSELDAIVYSYLSILSKATIPNNPLHHHIKACTNLVNFINRISKDIFKNEAFNSIKTNKNTSDYLLTPTERKFLESEKRTKIIAGIGAVAAMVSFAAWRGLFSGNRKF
ncbi:metaxin-1 homolog isoform X2 [Teleopsis dalmanni]|uniref:metaxin-1 homolog isoform X2 n=1 Tax=Teleopsis dalmanni TaxID=139649 RepID=UPI0018CF73C6|nr:metaxin-1 homolog isoform X2 [Teleopsis dalmanni]